MTQAPTPQVGEMVHVRGAAGTACRPALVIAPGPVLTWVRVFGANPRHDDEYGDVRHASDPLHVPNPDGTLRALDAWHGMGECDRWG